MNYLVLDVESSGFDPKKHALLEIAMIPVINGVKKEPFVSYVAPHEGAILDPKALEINKITLDQIKTFPDGKEVLKNLIEWLDSHETVFNLIGQNIQFDRNFLYTFFSRHMSHGEFITRIKPGDFCTLEMSKKYFSNKGAKPSSMKLGDLCKFFGIKLENAHSALPDVEATYELFLALKAMEPNIPVPTEKLTYQEKRTKYLDPSYVTFNAGGDIYINTKMTKDKAAARFIAEEIYRIYGS